MTELRTIPNLLGFELIFEESEVKLKSCVGGTCVVVAVVVGDEALVLVIVVVVVVVVVGEERPS